MEWGIRRWNELGNARGRNTSLVRVWEQRGRENGVHEVEWRCSERIERWSV